METDNPDICHEKPNVWIGSVAILSHRRRFIEFRISNFRRQVTAIIPTYGSDFVICNDGFKSRSICGQIANYFRKGSHQLREWMIVLKIKQAEFDGGTEGQLWIFISKVWLLTRWRRYKAAALISKFCGLPSTWQRHSWCNWEHQLVIEFAAGGKPKPSRSTRIKFDDFLDIIPVRRICKS